MLRLVELTEEIEHDRHASVLEIRAEREVFGCPRRGKKINESDTDPVIPLSITERKDRLQASPAKSYDQANQPNEGAKRNKRLLSKGDYAAAKVLDTNIVKRHNVKMSEIIDQKVSGPTQSPSRGASDRNPDAPGNACLLHLPTNPSPEAISNHIATNGDSRIDADGPQMGAANGTFDPRYSSPPREPPRSPQSTSQRNKQNLAASGRRHTTIPSLQALDLRCTNTDFGKLQARTGQDVNLPARGRECIAIKPREALRPPRHMTEYERERYKIECDCIHCRTRVGAKHTAREGCPTLNKLIDEEGGFRGIDRRTV